VHHDARTGAALPWPAPAVRVLDPTGAGDAFAGGFMAGLAGGDEVRGALARGVVSASFALEDYGAAALLAATPAEAEQRLTAWFG
jgi:ribokinase